MPSVEDEFSKLHDDITRFLTEEGSGLDSGDEDVELPHAARARPGTITPLGVRVDRGTGLLGSNVVNATLSEMDSVVTNIRAWKQKHEREMLELRQRNEQALSQVAETDCTLHQEQQHLQPLAQQLTSTVAGSEVLSEAGCGVAAAVLLPPFSPGDHLALSVTEQQQLGEDEDVDLAALLLERRERRECILLGSAAMRLRALTANLGAEQGQAQSQRQTVAATGTETGADTGPETTVRTGGGGGRSSRPWSVAGEASLESVLRAPPLGPAPPQPLERPRTAIRRKADEAASAVLLRGQQLFEELEVELRVLEGAGDGVGAGGGVGVSGMDAETVEAATWEVDRQPSSSSARVAGLRGGRGDGCDDDEAAGGGMAASTSASVHVDSLLDWSAQLQEVLAKMDALQTGYQAVGVVTAVVATPPDGGGAAAGQPNSGGAVSAAAGSGSGSFSSPSSSLLVLRPGSARLRLEPLARAPGFPAGYVEGQGREAGRTPSGTQSEMVTSFPSSSVVAGTGPVTGAGEAAAAEGVRGSEPGQQQPGTLLSGARAAGVSQQRYRSDSGGRRGDGAGEAVETGVGPMPFAGHRIRQLRELQRHGGAGTGRSGNGLAISSTRGARVEIAVEKKESVRS